MPSIVKVFTVTIPDGTFASGTFIPFVLGFIEFRTNYKFAQRRTDINDLVSGMVGEKESAARLDEREKIREQLTAAATGQGTQHNDIAKGTPDSAP